MRVLVVEDEALIAMDLETLLVRGGFEVLGPVHRLEQAMLSVRGETFDAALLDINLAGEQVFPVADVLAARGTPFVFLSGYGTSTLPERFRQRPLSRKPYSPRVLLATLRRALAC